MSSNFLNNGAVLPSGLLSVSNKEKMAGFNKTYRNFPLRVGVVVSSYPVGDDNNHSGLTNEYDVVVMEQNEDRGCTAIRYRNCMSSEGFGSMADFFECTFRFLKKKNSNGTSIDLGGQNGAIVLLFCLDGVTDKGIIISSLTHPDRPTTLNGTEPQLEGEYNGINIRINPDGSCAFTFKGATDNDGKPTEPSQGNTVAKIEKDGSFELSHSTITIRADRNGTTTINSTGNVNVTAAEVHLNGGETNVLTVASQPLIDSIYGEPSIGFSKVKTGI